MKCKTKFYSLPCVDARDSHFAKFATPRATWERTSGCPHLTIPSKALIPPSVLSLVCNLSNTDFQVGELTKQNPKKLTQILTPKEKSIPLPHKLAIAPATMRSV